MTQPARADLDRLARRTRLVYSLAWAAALVALGALAIIAFGRVRDNDFDARLAIHATAVYGLTYFDSTGHYHVEPMLREPDIAHAPFDVYVVDADGKTVLHSPERPRFAIDLTAPNIVATARGAAGDIRDAILAGGERVRILTKTTFDDADRPRAAIVVAGDPSPHRTEQRRFAMLIVGATALLAALGVLVAHAMVKRTLSPARRDLEVRERFLHAAAHELRTPVTGLVAAVESSGIEGPIATLSREASHVIEQVLAYARLDAGLAEVKRELFRLDLLVESLVDEGAPLDSKSSVVRGDVRLVTVAIRNLLANAERHGAGLREVRIVDGGVRVRDRGPGFPAHLLRAAPRSFDPGPGSEGWGLGLAIVHRIAEIHGGTLTLSNDAGGGGIATLSLSNDTTS